MKKLSVLSVSLLLVSLSGCASTSGSANVETGIINSKCALRPNEDVAAGKSVEYNGYAIGFCCDMCITGWESKSAFRFPLVESCV